jgi:autotransporter-associated beta strand protein
MLNKSGKGLLTIKTENAYTGGNRISGGAVIVTSLANSTQAKGNLGAVTTNASKFVIENGGELRTTAAVTNGSAIKFESETGGVINNSADFIVDRAMTGTKLTKKGTGWMKLNVNNTGLNTLVVAAGTVQCINSSTPAKTVEFQGGTLRENTGTSYTINVPQGKQGYWYMANRSTYKNKITGAGTLTAYCVTEKGTNYYATRTPVQCDFSNFEGTLVATSSLDDPSVLRFTLDTSSGMPKGTMNIGSNVEVQNSGKTFRIGKLTGSGALGGGCTFSNGASVGANTWQVGNDANWGCSVKVTSNSNLVKLGTGKITWSGANTNTGTTTIKEGELCIATSGKLGTGKLTIAQGATFSGANSTSKQLENASVEVNGILRPGSYNGAFSGTLFFSGKNVTLNQSAVYIVGTNKCATASANGCTALQNIGTLTINGTIRIEPVSSNTLAVGDSIRLWSNVTKFVGTPTVEGTNGIDWDDSRISEGLLFVKSIATDIKPQFADVKSQIGNIYDLRGRLVRKSATSTEGLKPGIYVIEGRKFVVK